MRQTTYKVLFMLSTLCLVLYGGVVVAGYEAPRPSAWSTTYLGTLYCQLAGCTMAGDLNGGDSSDIIDFAEIRIEDSATNTVSHHVMSHDTDGTVAANFGTGLKFHAETASGTAEHIGGFYCKETTATGGAVDTTCCLQTVAASSASDAVCFDSSRHGTAYGDLIVNGQLSTPFDTTQTPTGTTVTLDLDNSNAHTIDLGSATGDVTVTLSNPDGGASYIVKVIQGATARNIVWPATVLFPGGFTPTISTTDDDEDVFSLIYDGANYLTSYVQDVE